MSDMRWMCVAECRRRADPTEVGRVLPGRVALLGAATGAGWVPVVRGRTSSSS